MSLMVSVVIITTVFYLLGITRGKKLGYNNRIREEIKMRANI